MQEKEIHGKLLICNDTKNNTYVQFVSSNNTVMLLTTFDTDNDTGNPAHRLLRRSKFNEKIAEMESA
jgi:hypothetical protein